MKTGESRGHYMKSLSLCYNTCTFKYAQNLTLQYYYKIMQKPLRCLVFTITIFFTFPIFAGNQISKQLQKTLVDFTTYAEQSRQDWHVPEWQSQ